MSRLSELNLGGQVAKTLLVRIGLAAFGFAGTIVFARALGPTAFGGYYLLYTVVQVADRPFRGWTSAVEKRYSEVDAPRREILGSVIVFNLTGLLVTTPLVFLLRSRLAAFTGVEGAALLFLLLLGAEAFFHPLDQLVAAKGRIAVANYVDGLRSVLTLGLQLLFVAIGLEVAGMIYGLVGATLASIAINLYIVGRTPSVPGIESLRSITKFARYSIPASIVGQTYSRLDSLLLGLVLTPAVAGEYEVALKLTVPAVFVSNSIQQSMFPKMSNLHSQGKEISADIANSKAFASILAVPLLFGAFALSERIVVTAYGPDYRGAAVLLIGLALYRIVNTQAQIHVRTLEATDSPETVFKTSAVALAVNVPLGYALVLSYGAVGVVAATVVAEMLRYVLLVLATRQVVQDGLVPMEFLRQIAAGAVMFAAILFAKPLVKEWSWLVLLLAIGFGAVVYAVVLIMISRRLRVTARGILADLTEEGLA
ncbi:lipopolysaccharide biosynthesis protein [Halobellus ruber]|uniref:Oligosaccharide flippase family protein n=1 Tax=Halobellus ruber TaxID=2761102 RepID=A0A7J9SF36_9EURY|nr:oligosaccharide flippase family protein [Halobellus ruber]MBB6644719.1 oligosaccharide flippase family protein [Halobellus ruber]